MVVQRALPLLLAALTIACQSPESSRSGERAASPAGKSQTADKPLVANQKPGALSESEPPTPEHPKSVEPESAKPEPSRPLYYERALTDDDLKDRSLRELDLMRNTIYARIGQKFRKQWLRQYFSAQPWYQPMDDVDASTLGEVDLHNAERIVDFGNAITPATLREQRNALNEKMLAGTSSRLDTIEFQLIAARLGEWQGGSMIEERPSPLEEPERLDELLSVADLGDFSLRDLRILRNTVYARRGRIFNSGLLQMTFEDKAWYEPNPDFSGKLLTSIDRKNIRIVKSLEKELGGPISDWGHRMEEGWLYGA